MIVTCERCSTQFRLDDKRVPEQGVRVRCSRCKYAFRVEIPVSSEEERIQRAAARGLEPDTPDVTQDLPDEEEDWEFNDHRPSADAQESDAGEVEPDAQEPDAGEVAAESGAEEDGSAVETTEADPSDASGFGTLADSQSVPAPGGDDSDAASTPSELDTENSSESFGLGRPEGPFDLGGQDEAQSGLDLAGQDDSQSGLDLAGQDEAQSGLDLAGPEDPATGLDLGAAGESGPEPEAPPNEADAPGATEEIGSPDKWDFFAAEAPGQATTPPRVRMSATPPRSRTRRAAPAPRDLLDEELPPHAHWLERVVGSVGWVVVAAVFAAGLYGGFAPGSRGSAAASGSQHVADLQVADVGGRWVDNLTAGDLYVVSGVVRRDATAGSAAESGLFVTLLDAEGKRLRLAPIPVGPPLPQALLRQADPADLHSAAGQALSPRPGASLRVEAVIPAPPAVASAFRFITAADLAAPNANTAAPRALADAGDASGETLPSEPEVRPEEPNEAR